MKNITALITPFSEDLTIDYNSLRNLINFQEKSNISGILLLGTTSESFSLSLKEKLSICNLAFKTFSKIKIICIEENTLNKIINEIDIFKQFKPDYFLVTPPFFNKGNKKGIVEYFTKIADYSSSPIIIYNIPSRCGFDIDYDCLEILSRHKNIKGIKNASKNTLYNLKLSLLNTNDFLVMTGCDESIIENISLNNNGCISVLANIIPNYLTDIYETYQTNHIKAYNMFKKIIPLLEKLNTQTNPFPIKKLMKQLGITKDYLRSPFSNLEDFSFELSNERKILNEYFTNW